MLVLSYEGERYKGIDYYEELALDVELQNYIRTHISDSGGNLEIKTNFRNMLNVVQGYQYKINEAGGPRINSTTCLDGGNVGEVSEKEDENERFAYDFEVSDCGIVIDKPYFEPDNWVANEKELSSIIVDREIKNIPIRIRKRIYEIHSSFIFGNWMAVIALSRCLLEYAIIDKKGMLKIDLYYNDGQNRRKPLAYLVSDTEETVPELKKSMKCIIEAGNGVMHPSPRGKFPPDKAVAKTCIDDIVKIIGTLYSKPKNSGNPFN